MSTAVDVKNKCFAASFYVIQMDVDCSGRSLYVMAWWLTLFAWCTVNIPPIFPVADNWSDYTIHLYGCFCLWFGYALSVIAVWDIDWSQVRASCWCNGVTLCWRGKHLPKICFFVKV